MKRIQGLLALILIACSQITLAASAKPAIRLPSRKPGVRVLRLSSDTVAVVRINLGRSTVLSFPTKPTKVILGNQGVFAVEYVDNDVAIAALSGHAHSNLFAYLEGRRFAFDLQAVPSGGDTIVLVRDEVEQGLRVNTK